MGLVFGHSWEEPDADWNNEDMSRLGQMIGNADAAFDALKKSDEVEKQVSDAGDAFELAARAALGAWDARNKAPLRMLSYDSQNPGPADPALTFEIGYQTACGELAVVLRAMRHGHPPDKAELDLIQDEVEKALS